MEMIEEKNMDMSDLAKELSEVSRKAGKVSFKITFTATPGNIEIQKRFQQFCFDQANNEYLMGIGKLLDYAAFLGYLVELEQRVEALERGKVVSSEVSKEDDSVKKVKTF